MSQGRLDFSGGKRNRFIEAGAGTGKTTEIVAQVLRIALEEPGVAAERIVLITFTEKAAGEIAERIRDALVDLHLSFSGPRPGWPSALETPIVSVPPGKEAQWKRACEARLAQLDKLRSQTIHSFCQSILSQHPIEAGLDPSFRIVERYEASRLYDEVWRAWADAETTGKDDSLRRQWEHAVDALESVQALRATLLGLAGQRSILADEEYPIPPLAVTLRPVREAIDELRRADRAEIEKLSRDEAWAAVLAHVRGVEAPSTDGHDEWLAWLRPVRWHLRHAKMPSRSPLKEALKALRGQEADENLHDAIVDDRAARALRAMAVRFFRRLEEEKDRRRVLDFDDLLIRTDRLLREPRIANEVRSRYDYFFVDEFQDTDRLQARILDRLLRDAHGEIVHGRMVLVGDPKQSIYSFRRADPETYGATLEMFASSHAEIRPLERQFRSDPDLVRALNAMFRVLFSDQGDVNVFRPLYHELEAGREKKAPGTTRIRFLRAERPPEAEAPGDSRERQARAVASLLRERQARGGRLEDVAVLFRKLTDIEPWLDLFDRAGIPWVLPRNTSVLSGRTATELLAVLRAVAAPFDTGARISAARSSFFGLTDDEAAEPFLARAMEEPLSPAAPWAKFEATLREWRDLARSASAAGMLQRIAEDTGVEVAWRLLAHGEERLSDLDALHEVAREYDRSEGGSIAAFVDELLRRREGPEEGDPAILDEEAPGIRIMTAHASKGLEFDTVILPDLSAGTMGDSLSLFTTEEPRWMFFRGRLSTAAATRIEIAGRTPSAIAKERGEAETDRLFYVAVTRAREEVVFVIDPDKTTKAGFVKPLQKIFDLDLKALAGLWPGEGARFDSIAAGDRRVEVAFETAPSLVLADRVTSRLADPRLTSLLERSTDEPEVPAAGPADRGELARRAASLRQRDAGILLHRALELWEGGVEGLDAALQNAARESGAPGPTVELVRRRLAGIARSPALAALGEGRFAGREVSIWTEAGGVRREGRIDRLIREGAGWLVLDYKSGRPSPARVESDRAQVEAYCRAIARMSGEACRGLLWYIEEDDVRSVDLPNDE